MEDLKKLKKKIESIRIHTKDENGDQWSFFIGDDAEAVKEILTIIRQREKELLKEVREKVITDSLLVLKARIVTEDLKSDWPKEHVMTIDLVLSILRDLDKKQLKKLKELEEGK